ncbi:hypothetical protein [Mycobacterium leprae]|uniref:hypothetical protein n=1 Tax=Mycobacterium leprae TaxID=1769 RepID=UPI00030B34B2
MIKQARIAVSRHRDSGFPVVFAMDKTYGLDRSGQVLFIDACGLGYLLDLAERALTDDEVARIDGTYHVW